MVLKLELAPESPGGLVKTQIANSRPQSVFLIQKGFPSFLYKPTIPVGVHRQHRNLLRGHWELFLPGSSLVISPGYSGAGWLHSCKAVPLQQWPVLLEAQMKCPFSGTLSATMGKGTSPFSLPQYCMPTLSTASTTLCTDHSFTRRSPLAQERLPFLPAHRTS